MADDEDDYIPQRGSRLGWRIGGVISDTSSAQPLPSNAIDPIPRASTMADEEDRIIWAWREDHGDVWTGEWAPPGEDHIPDHAQEYIPRAEADAMVVAALRMAADECTPHDDDDSLDRQAKAECRDAILSITPADAASALDEVRRQAYREGWRFAFGQCKHTGSVHDPDHKQEDRK